MSHIARDVAKTVYQARWWIVVASVLCFADQAIRAYLFHLGVKRFIYAFLFYSALAVAPAFLLGRRTSRLLTSVHNVFYCRSCGIGVVYGAKASGVPRIVVDFCGFGGFLYCVVMPDISENSWQAY